MPVYDYLLMMQ